MPFYSKKSKPLEHSPISQSMQKLLLHLLLMASLSPVAFAQYFSDVPITPIGYDSAYQIFCYSRSWSYYNPYPSNFI
jgi:hypothetical protein